MPRLQNCEADELSNEIFVRFDPENRVLLEVEKFPWIILPDIIRLGHSLFEDLEEIKGARRAGPVGFASVTERGGPGRRNQKKRRK